MHRTTRLVVALVAFALLAGPGRVVSQQFALGAGAADAAANDRVNRALLAAALKPGYTVNLASNWPELRAADGSCVNGGREVLTGRLDQTSGGNYVGKLVRRASIQFCGAHGAATERCSLTLESEGAVAANGEVRRFPAGWAQPVVALRWVSLPADNDVTVSGDCPPAFNQALRRMFLGVTHLLEFELPTTGEGRLAQRLDDYGWIVEVE
jgi:hypothetical protein